MGFTRLLLDRKILLTTRFSGVMKFTASVLSLALTTTALALCPYAERAPKDPEFLVQHLKERDAPKAVKQHEKRQSGPGNIPFTTFNENQLIDVTGDYAWVAPGPNDIRGPCPGLNALANHGYFPHSGVVPLAVGASATEKVYGLTPTSSSCYVVLTIARSCCGLRDSLDRLCYTCRWRCRVSDPSVFARKQEPNAKTTSVGIHGALEANSRRV